MAKFRHFFSNIVCGFIWNRDRRKKVRAILNSNIFGYLVFIRKNIGERIWHFKIFIGFRGSNLLIEVNRRYIFKFQIPGNKYPYDMPRREKRVVDALRPAPMGRMIPHVDLLDCHGMSVRKYDFIPGITMRDLPADCAPEILDNLATQVARFVYDIASANPKQIADLKPDPRMRPGYMRGWFHGDIYENFFIDPKTMQVTAFFDWEDCYFGDFAHHFAPNHRCVHPDFMVRIGAAYDKIWADAH